MDYILNLLPLLFEGVKVTIFVFLMTAILAIPLGLLVSFGRMSKFKPLSWLIRSYILIMRGTPLLLQIIFIFFGLPAIGITFDRMTAVLIGFVLNYAAYFAEIFRGGFISIDEGQYEAGKVLGMSKSVTFRTVILPQLTKRVLPPIGNELITLVKDTSLVYILGVGDLLRVAKTTANVQANIFPYFWAAVIYLILVMLITFLLDRSEQKMGYYRG